MPVNFGHNSVGLGAAWTGRNRVVNINTSVWLLDEIGNVIGAAQHIDYRSRRNTQLVRFIDGFQGGKIQDQIPQPEEITLTARSVLLYMLNNSSDLVNVARHEEYSAGGAKEAEYHFYPNSEKRAYLGATSLDRFDSNSQISPGYFLNLQFTPFDLWIVVFNPVIEAGSALIFTDCFVRSYGFTIDMGQGIIVENMEIVPTGWRHEFDREVIKNLLGNVNSFLNLFNKVAR